MSTRPRRLPPLDELRAFEAVARHLSFAAAADELNLTPSAISHRIRRLEEHFRIRLFRRLSPGVALTEEGRILLSGVEAGFGRLAQASKRVRSRSGRRSLTIFARPSFATYWLTPRLAAFLDGFPEVEPLILGQQEGEPNFDGDGVDIAVTKVSGTPKSVAANEAVLLQESVAMVCSPRLPTNERPLSEPRHLLQHILIQIDQDLADCFDWDWWMERYGLSEEKRPRVVSVSHTASAMEAARGGQGVALINAALASYDIAAGTLMRPFPEDAPILGTYVLRWPESAAGDEVVMALKDFLIAAATPTSHPG